METQSFLIVKNIENFTADNGRKFQKVLFQEQKILPNGTALFTRNQRTRNIWDASVDGQVKPDAYYGNLSIGMVVEGRVVRFNTTPYIVDGRTVTEWTGVVFSDENPVKYANSQLKNNNASVVDEHGQPTVNTVSTTPSVVNEGTPVGADDDKDF